MSTFTTLRRSFLTSASRAQINATTIRSSPRHFSTSTARMVVHNLKSKAEFEEAKASGKLIIIDAYATWCGPCKVIAPKLVEYSEAHDSVGFYKVDVDEVPDVAKELGIRAMPTFVLFKEGAEVETIVGANPKAIEAALVKHKA